jgi:hypothetical protein
MKCYATLFGMLLLSVAALAATPALAQIPEPNGQYSIARHGSFADCLNPAKGYAEESCSASGVFVYPITVIAVGSITYASGNGCGTDTEVFSALPPNAMPSTLGPETVVVKVTKYNSTTGIGSASYTGYSGGSCDGANFDSSGATVIATATLQFVVTRGGWQVDITFTQLTNPINSLGSASLFDTDLKQTRTRWSK